MNKINKWIKLQNTKTMNKEKQTCSVAAKAITESVLLFDGQPRDIPISNAFDSPIKSTIEDTFESNKLFRHIGDSLENILNKKIWIWMINLK